jgi:hypothetical protein
MTSPGNMKKFTTPNPETPFPRSINKSKPKTILITPKIKQNLNLQVQFNKKLSNPTPNACLTLIIFPLFSFRVAGRLWTGGQRMSL